MMKTLLIAILFISLPLIQAQVEQPVEQPIIPADIAGALTGVGSGPAIAFILDILDTCVAWGTDFIDTIVAFIMAVWAKTFGALLSPFVAFCAFVFTGFGICPWDSWLMLCWHCCDLIPCVACIPHAWSVVKSCAQFIGI